LKSLKACAKPPFFHRDMIDVGIAGPIGTALAWLCALLFLASSMVSGRVVWALAVRGARRGAVRVAGGSLGLTLALGLGVGHFAGAPQTLEVSPSGDWQLYDAYGLTVDAVPSNEVRQARLTSPVGSAFTRLEVRRADGRSLVLFGDQLRDGLGYAFNACGAWADRPVWGPHAYDALGPRCDDEPWPAALRTEDRMDARLARYAAPRR